MMTQSPFIFAGSQPDLSLTLSDATTLDNGAMRPSGSAYGQLCKSVKKIQSKTITSIGNYGFANCSVLEEVDLPNVQMLGEYALALANTTESNTSPMTTLNLPKVQTIKTRALSYRQQLQTVTLGSPGNPVTSISSSGFGYCTQSGLVINIYTTGGASLSNSPFGATNATVNFLEA